MGLVFWGWTIDPPPPPPQHYLSQGGGSARLKIDQAAAAVKSLKEQLADKDRQLETTQSKIEHALRIGVGSDKPSYCTWLC